MPQIADTGFLVAFWNRADAYHRWARGLDVRAPLHTCEAVLTEAAYLLGCPEPLLQMLVDGDLIVNFDSSLHAPELLRWLEKYADLDPLASPMPAWCAWPNSSRDPECSLLTGGISPRTGRSPGV